MKIHLSNSTNRDATVVATSTPAKEGAIPSKGGKPVSFQRYVAAGEGKLHKDLSKAFGDVYSQQLIDSDPEIDLEIVGRVIEGTNTLLLDKDDQPLYCAPEILEIIEEVVASHKPEQEMTLESVLAAEVWARETANRLIANRN